MTVALDLTIYLGAATERLLAEAFADKLTITAGEAALLLDLDEKGLRAMTEEGVIRAVRKGKRRSYTERDLRAYLIEGPDIECRAEKQKAALAPGRGKVVKFSDIVAGAPARR